MIYSKRGRPKRTPDSIKRPVATVKLVSEDSILLQIIARREGVSVYKLVEDLVHKRIDEYLVELDNDYETEYEDYSTYPPDIDEDDETEWVEV